MTDLSLLLKHDHPVYQAMLLAIACAIVSLALIGGYQATHERITELELHDQLNTLGQVLPAERYNNNPLDDSQPIDDPRLLQPAELMLAKHAGDLTAVALKLRVAGWGGPIDLLVATETDGTVLGVRVIRHKETPGLADGIEIAKSDWITGFNGKSLTNTPPRAWAVKKDDGDFDQFTGATITPRAVVKGVHTALELQQSWHAQQQQTQRQQAQAQGKPTGTGQQASIPQEETQP